MPAHDIDVHHHVQTCYAGRVGTYMDDKNRVNAAFYLAGAPRPDPEDAAYRFHNGLVVRLLDGTLA